MGIQKPYLDSFTAKELMAFIDCYVENHVLPQMPDHSPAECDLLARFLGFGYSREWSQGEIEILTGHYYGSGAEKTAQLLPLRSPLDCVAQAQKLGLRTTVKPKRKGGSPWMLWEIELVEKYYPVIGSKVSILLPDRSEYACRTKAVELKSTTGRVRWSESEIEILEKYYPQIGLDVADFLPGKSRENIYRRAGLMSLASPSHWTPAEDELLRSHYPDMGKKSAKFFLGRRSETACIRRAVALGLSFQDNRQEWSDDELSVLDKYYPQIGQKVAEMLPRRTVTACQKKAVQRGLSYRPEKVSRSRTVCRWSAEELDILRKNYPKMRAETYRLLPNRTKMACMKMAASLGLESTNNHWSTEEDNILRQNYAKMGSEVSVLLPGRSPSACHGRAKALKLYREGLQWSSEEDTILKEHYPREGVSAFQRIPNRTNAACQARVTYLKICRARASENIGSNQTGTKEELSYEIL